MANCGDYELEAAIGWGRHATFFSARANGGKGPATIVIRRARSTGHKHRDVFLRAAAEQQAATQAGCKRLAPILAFDCDEAGFAYSATTRYETSIAEYLGADCKVDETQMREIVSGVLAALSELEDKSRRAHGNLTAGNVLLDSQGRIFLTDLAPSSKDATAADDLFALGTLIYQLVRRTARIGALNPPLDYSPAWTESLGGDAEGWREFTNRVLTKSRNEKSDALKSASADLKKLGSLAAKATAEPLPIAPGEPKVEVRRAPPKKKSPLPIIFAVILLLAGGGGGYVWWQRKEKEKKEESARREREKNERDFQKTLPLSMKNLPGELKHLPTDIAADRTLNSLLGRLADDLKGAKSREAIQSLVSLVPQNWEVPVQMTALANKMRTPPRAWLYLAGKLEAAKEIAADDEASIIGQFQNTIATHDAADRLDREWDLIVLTLKDLASAKNRLLPDFAPWAAAEIRSAPDFAVALSRAAAALKTLGELRDFQRDKWERVVQIRFEKEAADVLRTPGDELMPGWPTRWQREAERLVGPTEEKRDEWTKLLANAEARMAKLSPKEQAVWQPKLLAARSATTDALESQAAAIDAQIREFEKMRLPIEVAAEQYTDFLAKWQPDAAKAAAKKDALILLAKFQTETAKLLPAYQIVIRRKELAKQMEDALNTPDKITLLFSQPAAWELLSADAGMAEYLYQKRVRVPFIALGGKTGVAMAAIETPLALARLAGFTAQPPSPGPKIRTGDFSPEQVDSWVWKGPLDFMRDKGINSYFPQGVNPGDVGNELCPVTWLTFEEARTLAKKLGGELPTESEWKSALDRTGDTKRLRSKAWTAQVNQVTQWSNLYKKITRSLLPDIGSFSKQFGLTPAAAYLNDTNESPNAANDGSVWLKSAVPNGGWQPKDKFYHLIGNAAEWVTDSNGNPAIIGGSVVSPPSLPTTTPLPLRNGAAAFDVTFRLVVKTGEGGEGVGLAKFKEAAAAITVPPLPTQ